MENVTNNPVFSISYGAYKASYYNPIPSKIISRMMDKSYKKDCPVAMADLAYVKVSHYNMKGEVCLGELVVHRMIVPRIIEIFRKIFAAKFPIEKMRLIDEYDTDDDRSMADNNSSAFCFRGITGNANQVSRHGEGLAVDINPRLNPYVNEQIVAPDNARDYVNRSKNEPGMIHSDSVVVKAFKEAGFEWGGEWTSPDPTDYQHFEIDEQVWEKLQKELPKPQEEQHDQPYSVD